MRWIINYIRSCFCKHEWELIFHANVKSLDGSNNHCKTYRCTKCGYSKKYYSN